ncbi:MAG TPA: beta galactosidase jelly roll domain-containing protein [Abditibacteriaceae bacterium]|nr:beta galactosidase jelly roll domain-containing protein [Abditibacteriaceae bacterium]
MKSIRECTFRVLLPLGLCALASCAASLQSTAYAQDAAAAVEPGKQYSAGDYSVVHQLPDEMVTVFDPNAVGHRMRYQSPAINDLGFVTTKTHSLTWEAQGLAGLRKGAVWYRYRFKLPAEVKGKPIGLFLGGFEDEARVWLNGKVIGTSGADTSGKAPNAFAVFDLTDGVQYDGDNLVAIQVVRHGDGTTNRTGGIIRPSFIFTGPRLPKKAPKPLELRRVLPGGELGEIEE